jgi:dCMP deaminase
MNQKFIDYYMRIADITAELSYAKRLQVGALIVKEHKILATGYNGTPAGWDNNCEDVEWCSAGGWLDPEEIIEGWPYEGTYLDRDGNEMQNRYRLKTKPEVLHAEMNSLMKVTRSTESSEGATLFCTHAPCMDCAKAIYQAGIKQVVYREKYRSTSGINFLEACGINVMEHMKDDK